MRQQRHRGGLGSVWYGGTPQHSEGPRRESSPLHTLLLELKAVHPHAGWEVMHALPVAIPRGQAEHGAIPAAAKHTSPSFLPGVRSLVHPSRELRKEPCPGQQGRQV